MQKTENVRYGMHAWLLKNARVIDPENGIDEVRDIGVGEGLIVPPESLRSAHTVDLSGYVVAPGFIDLHVHLRDLGQTHKEDIASGTRAAAAGGFTAVVAMPNTTPAMDTPELLHALQERCREHALVRVLLTAALTLGRKGQELTDAAALKAAGAVALTDDGACIQNAALMREAMGRAQQAGLPVIDHCEESSLADGGAVNLGPVARKLGVRGIPALAEELMVARDLLLAGELNVPVHIQHVSSARSVALLRWGRALGLPVTAEVTPHHLCLTEDACIEHGANAKMNPPLRTESDRAALRAALRDGIIDCIATDHAPHTAAEKELPLEAAPFGVIGLEAAVPVCLTELVHKGVLTLRQCVERFSSGPRRVLGLPGGTLSPGSPADITVLDLNHVFQLDTAEFLSRARNCPFQGWQCRGRAAGTMVGGQWVFSHIPGIEGRAQQEKRQHLR